MTKCFGADFSRSIRTIVRAPIVEAGVATEIMKKVFQRTRGHSLSHKQESHETEEALKASPYENAGPQTPPRLGTTPIRGNQEPHPPTVPPPTTTTDVAAPGRAVTWTPVRATGDGVVPAEQVRPPRCPMGPRSRRRSVLTLLSSVMLHHRPFRTNPFLPSRPEMLPRTSPGYPLREAMVSADLGRPSEREMDAHPSNQ